MSKKHCVFYPSPNQEESKDTTKLLSDLGRATKRGIKKCFKCGTYNGIRGLMCKNKNCDAVFKEYGDQQTNLDAIKLISGTSRQVFSVRVRDKGPDCRGFVQLPLIQGSNEVKEKNVALSEVALCFVDSCQRLFDDSILKCHETEQNRVASVCIHIRSALKSINTAVPIETKSCLLDSFSFNEEIKNKLWLLYTETKGALVQRVSKTVMAVKCQVTPKHPLGYLHFTFCVTKGKVTYHKFYCSCLCFTAYNCLKDSSAVVSQKCIHYYACIWAFISDSRFTEEFLDFLNLELYVGNEFLTRMLSDDSANLPLKSTSKQQKSEHCSKKYADNLHISKNMVGHSTHPAEMKVQQRNQKRLLLKLSPSMTKKQKTNTHPIAKCMSISFPDWLTFVTERINQALCYNHNERVESLSFYISQDFFKSLTERLESSSRKSTHSYVISGMRKISYLIFSIPYVKEVFDTKQVPLQIMELFLQNKDGIFTKAPCEGKEHLNKSFIECKQFITYLKVGGMKNDTDSFPFTINWVSNLLPVSNFGKLEITFHVGCSDAEQFNKQFF